MKLIPKISTIIILCLSLVFVNLGEFAYSQTSNQLNSEVKILNDDISSKKQEMKRLEERQEEYSEAIEQAQKEKASLNNQLAILDNRVAKSELDIELTETEIERIELEIQKTDKEIDDSNNEIEIEKTKISNILKILNKQDNVSYLEIILLNDSLSEFMSQSKYLEDINASIKSSLDNLYDLKEKLDKNKTELNKKNQALLSLKEELEQNLDKLEAEKETKQIVIAQVSSSESEYQRLIELSKKEQEDAAAEIATMEKQVRAKLAALEGKDIEFNDNGIAWPVPKNVITAYFHDPDYPFRSVYEHPAIDIRAGQGTTLKAAASGYVARVKDGGATGYSYIMIIHGDGLSTVYGHVSKIYIAEDEYVVQGQTIGKTGGLPGTPGAGRLTTGPHLHFEVRLNGIPVDPLSYLP